MEEADKAVYTEVKVEINIAEEPVPLYLTDLCTGVIKDVRADRAVPAWTQHTAEGDAVANGHSDIVVKTEAGEDQPGLLHDFSHETSWTGKCLPAPNSEGKEGWGTRKPGESEHNEYPSAPELSVEDLRTSDKNPGRPHACPLCPATYKNSTNLKEHMFKHTGEKLHACEKCDDKFSLPNLLRHHMRIHSGQRPYKCPHCDGSFMQPRTLTQHLRKGHPTLYKSSSAADRYLAVANSIRTINRTLEKPYTCHLCSAAYKNSCNLKEHMFKHTGEKDHACAKCDDKFSMLQHLKSHMRIHSRQRPYKCPRCDASFMQPGALTLHLRKGHPTLYKDSSAAEWNVAVADSVRTIDRTLEKPYSSHLCTAVANDHSDIVVKTEAREDQPGLLHDFSHDTTWTGKCLPAPNSEGKEGWGTWKPGESEHNEYPSACELSVEDLRTSDKNPERPHACPLYPATYKRPGHLREHMLKHTREKYYACEKCDDTFRLPQYLKQHMRIHSGQRPHKCPHCDATFMQPRTLTLHLRKGHPTLYGYSSAAEWIVAVSDSVRTIDRTLEKPYTCHLCPAAYKQSHHLREHMFKHTGEKAHACAKCDEAFSLPQHLKRHLLSHTGQRPYECQHCDASFLRHDFLARHIQVGHPKLSDRPSATEVSVGVESSTSSSNSNLDSPATEVNTCQNEVSSTECNWAVVVKLEPTVDM
ncbi:zinc finger protein 271-like [Littorina saxatilis]|uniref:zinc finger protein 271-like n=1 Tax=Littorina saxatilis TaxID=31220 RepID=UPI0038B4AEA7